MSNEERSPSYTPELAEHFETFAKQERAGRLGMWLFLASEVLLFAGLFALYGSYRSMYGEDFQIAQTHNNALLGTINTFVLITSSFTVAMAIHTTRTGRLRLTTGLLALTILFGLVFMVVKALEYGEHFAHGLYPGQYFHPHEASLDNYGARTFFTLYYFMTGLHAFHVFIGLVVLSWALGRAWKRKFSPKHHLGLELAGLYWHLVDLIWIYVWPLLYLTS